MVHDRHIKLHEAEILNDRILMYKLSFTDDLKKIIFSNQFYVKYDKPISNIEKDILNIPGIGCLASVAWVTGSTLTVDTVDMHFMHSDSYLSTFQKFINNQYNNVFSAGKIAVKEFKTNRFSGKKLGLLFSGGVDSTSVYIKDRRKKPDLISIIGGVVPVDNRKFVDRFKNDYKRFSRKESVEISFIETNIREVLNEGLLTSKIGKYTGYLPWWRLTHLIVQFSLCAPITSTNNFRSLLLSGTLTDCECYPDREKTNNFFHGNETKFHLWSSVDTIFTNLEVPRHNEIKTISKFIKNNGYLKLQVCNFSPKYNQFNCGICDKCSYTITSLFMEGLNPIKLGFPIVKNFPDSVMNLVSKGNVERAFWKNVQENISSEKTYNSNEIRKLIDWLKTHNFDSEKETNIGFQIMKYPLFLLYSLLPKPMREHTSSIGRNFLWACRKNLIHLLSTS